MRPKQATISRRIGGRARRGVPAAAACVLVIAAVGGCGGGAQKAAPAAESAPDASSNGLNPNDAFSPEGLAAAAAAHTGDTEFISAATGAFPSYAVTGTSDLKVGKGPVSIAVNPRTNKIYVANQRDNTLTVIDGKTNKTTTLKGKAVGPSPVAVAINTKTNTIYVANQKGKFKDGSEDPNGNGTVTVIDGATNKMTSVPAQLEATGIAVNETTNKVYISNQGSNDMTVIDGKTNKGKTVSLRPANPKSIYDGLLSPQDVKVNEKTNKIYITGVQSNTVAVIDGKTNRYTTLVTEGTGTNTQSGLTPTYLAIDSIHNKIYTANFTSNDVTVIDGATNKMTSVALEDVQDPYAIAVNPVTQKVFVATLTSKSISVIDGATDKLVMTVGDLPGKPHDMAINTKTNKIYIPMYVLYKGAQVGDDTQITGVIQEMDGATYKLTSMVAGVTPYAVATNPVTNKTYVTNQDGNTVTVLSEPARKE